jgi:hypothetical protein
MTVTPRKPWSNEETDTLIRIWEDVGSIILLSILLDRSTSSVQTQASRIGLPRRQESLQRHRRRWSRAEERQLNDLIAKHSTSDNKIRIYDVARDMTRSVDAIAAKLMENLEHERDLLDRVVIPDAIRRKLKDPQAGQDAPQHYKRRGEIEDTRSKSKRRDCLICRTGFWSEGAHNRICGKCTAAHENDEAYGGW